MRDLEGVDRGLLALWLPSHATLDTPDLDQAQELARIQETGMAITQLAIKVNCLTMCTSFCVVFIANVTF